MDARQAAGERRLACVGAAYLAFAACVRDVGPLVGSLCPWRALTGHPCVLCGMTRAWGALLHGDVAGAFLLHPVAPLLLPLWLSGTAVLWVRVARRRCAQLRWN